MKSQETKQSEQAHVSAPSESSKDEKQDESCTTAVKYTAEERLLARKHKVEPKLIRLLDDIFSRRTRILNDVIDDRTRELESSIDEKLQLLDDIIKERPAEPETTAAESEPEEIKDETEGILAAGPADQPESEIKAEPEKLGPNTGTTALDNFLENLSYDATIVAYGVLEIMGNANDTGNKILIYLRKEANKIRNLESNERNSSLDITIWAELCWLFGFVDGAEVGRDEA